MNHSSNRDRIARAAAEARLTQLEKEAQRDAKAAQRASGAKRTKRVAEPPRVKIVWQVCTPIGAVVATFAYPDKPAAEAKVAELTRSSGRVHELRATKVPMD